MWRVSRRTDVLVELSAVRRDEIAQHFEEKVARNRELHHRLGDGRVPHPVAEGGHKAHHRLRLQDVIVPAPANKSR